MAFRFSTSARYSSCNAARADLSGHRIPELHQHFALFFLKGRFALRGLFGARFCLFRIELDVYTLFPGNELAVRIQGYRILSPVRGKHCQFGHAAQNRIDFFFRARKMIFGTTRRAFDQFIFFKPDGEFVLGAFEKRFPAFVAFDETSLVGGHRFDQIRRFDPPKDLLLVGGS